MGKRLWLFIFLGAVILGALGLQLWTPATLETGSWGLKFNGQGEPPTGNASSAQLSQFDAVYMGDPAEKVLYLTFDAGYENGCTEKILDTLKAHQVQATFFLVGDYLAREGVSVITGPILTDRSKGELRQMSLANTAALAKAGVQVAICTDHPETPVPQLLLCAAMAARWGMDEEEALAAITINAACIAVSNNPFITVSKNKMSRKNRQISST